MFYTTNKECYSELDYLEMHVVHHCNLNCKDCGHYSNLFNEEFVDINGFRNDLIRMKCFFENIRKIRLLGGEPLLNKNLAEFIVIAKSVYPLADLRIVTNGLLIPSANDDLFEIMREYDVSFDISLYPPTELMLKRIMDVCNEKNVNYKISSKITHFFDFSDNEEPCEKEKVFSHCIAKKCHFLLDGNISVCPMPVLRMKMKKINWKHCFEEDVVNIYDKSLTAEKLYNFLNNPLRQCTFCKSQPEKYEWQCRNKTDGMR